MRKLLNHLFWLVLIIPASVSTQTLTNAVYKDSTVKKEKEQEKIEAAQAKTLPPVWNNITFLNAANFDFSTNFSGNYLGKLNIFAPDIGNSPFGFNAGMMRTKFNYKDTSNSPVFKENRYLNPLDTPKQGAKYLRELNQYTTTRTNTVWSFYAQPMFRIVSWPWNKNDRLSNGRKRTRSNSISPNGIYLHIHTELLVNITNVTTDITNLKRDTSLMDTAKHLSYIVYQRNPLIYDKTFLNGYFGAGVTVNLDPFNNGNSRFFFQATVGKTTDYPHWTSEDISSAQVTIISTRGGTTVNEASGRPIPGSSGFYLVRCEFAQLLNDNSEIILGTDIRGLFPKYNPQYAAYMGLNINLNALVKVIMGKGSTTPSNAATLTGNTETKPTTITEKKTQ